MKYLLILFSTLILASCSKEPQAINYGKDACENCRMTIIDKKFGGELINSKGKTLKFDSGECMLKYLSSHHEFKVSKIMIVDYSNPGILMEADKAIYLQGGNINSPMGGNLAAFATNEEAEKAKQLVGGNINLWKAISHLEF
jgi:copper chaperone NosL